MFTLVLESALVGYLVSLLGNKLVSFAENEIGRITNVKQTLRLLESRVWGVQAKLDRLRGPDPEVISTYSSWKGWVRKVTELCYDVDDIIEDELNRSHVLSVLDNWGLARKLNKLLDDLQCIEQGLDSLIVSRIPELNNNHNLYDVIPISLLSLPRGRQTDRDNIVGRLLAGSTTNNKGVSIVGRAGLGKTTLARSIVDDPRIRQHFHSIKWSSPTHDHLNNIDPVALHYSPPLLRRLLTWPRLSTWHNAVKTLWVFDSLEEYPSFDYVSSRTTLGDHVTFLITSRDPRVATSTQTTAYYLKRMSDEECEELIREIVYPVLSNSCDKSFFDSRARNIAKKSMGLPLVASLLGRALRDDRDTYGGATEAIIYFEQTDLWELIGRQILTSLRFDGRKLAPHMKKLVYFTLFPHDHLLTKDHLLRLWMAEGFVQHEGWTNPMLAQEHLDDMLPVSMVEPSSNGLTEERPSAYQTNEIAHGFGRSMACNMCFRMDNGEHYSPTPDLADIDARHFSVCCQNIPKKLLDEIAQHFKRLRTFLLLHQYGTNISAVPSHLFQKLVSLRVLDLSRSSITILPCSIRKLKHLRYLDLSRTKIKSLPDSVCKLLRLVILKLFECSSLRELPKITGKLVNLIHLELGQGSLCPPPKRLGRLTKLQTLNAFLVKKDEGYHIKELKNLNALRGSIEIRQLENVEKEEEALEAALEMKKDLRTLSLEWAEFSMPIPIAAEAILTHLQPHSNLSELTVKNYSGIKFPSWIGSPSCHLRSIHLYNCPYCEQLPAFSNLPFLKTLHIESLSMISSIGRVFFGDLISRFKSLERLQFCNMEKLYEFQGLEPGDMPSLWELKFECCPQLTVLPTVQPLSSLTYLEITRCPKLDKRRLVPPSLKQYLFEGQLIPLTIDFA